MQVRSGNYVPWFVKTIAEFGGEFVPVVDNTPSKVHSSGRRESRIELRYVGEPEYLADDSGSLRSVVAQAVSV
jgi:hypothetical protein